MSEQPDQTTLDAGSAFEAEMLVRLFKQVTRRMPTEKELEDAKKRLDQIKGTDE